MGLPELRIRTEKCGACFPLRCPRQSAMNQRLGKYQAVPCSQRKWLDGGVQWLGEVAVERHLDLGFVASGDAATERKSSTLQSEAPRDGAGDVIRDSQTTSIAVGVLKLVGHGH